MKPPVPKASANRTRGITLAKCRERLVEAEETLRAIRAGEVDAVVVQGEEGPRVFTLESADHAYRILIESMHEGAVSLTTGMRILYANRSFARMIKVPLQRVIGGSIRDFLRTKDGVALRKILQGDRPSGSKIQIVLRASDGSQVPAQASLRPLPSAGTDRAAVGMVVTDMSEVRRNEEMLRTLSGRLVQAQESERGRVALELHDHITQLLCAILVRCQSLADAMSAGDGTLRKEAIKLREMLGQTAEEVERISRNLRPGVLDNMGLVPVLRDTCTEFARRTGIALTLTCQRLASRLPADTELTLYRILQEALMNVERHSRASAVSVRLLRKKAFVQLSVTDNGIGFTRGLRPRKLSKTGGIGLLSMRERAVYVGGELTLAPARGGGTEVRATIPLPRRSRQ